MRGATNVFHYFSVFCETPPCNMPIFLCLCHFFRNAKYDFRVPGFFTSPRDAASFLVLFFCPSDFRLPFSRVFRITAKRRLAFYIFLCLSHFFRNATSVFLPFSVPVRFLSKCKVRLLFSRASHFTAKCRLVFKCFSCRCDTLPYLKQNFSAIPDEHPFSWDPTL